MNKEKSTPNISLTPFSHSSSPLYFTRQLRGADIPSPPMAAATTAAQILEVANNTAGFHRLNGTYDGISSYENLTPMAQSGQSVIVPNSAVLLQQSKC